MKLFVVDDSEALRGELVRQLSELPHMAIVGEAATFDEAVQGVAITRPDVMTLDIQLAAGTGMEVLGSIRHLYPSMIIIILTNYAQSQYRTRCLAAGADYFFDKSTEFEQVIELCGRMRFDHGVTSDMERS
ncbi:MAG: response regulator transcription factor [bacterium]